MVKSLEINLDARDISESEKEAKMCIFHNITLMLAPFHRVPVLLGVQLSRQAPQLFGYKSCLFGVDIRNGLKVVSSSLNFILVQ